MQFNNFRDKLTAHFHEMVKTHDRLFVADVDKDELYSKYLDSFPAGMNPAGKRSSAEGQKRV